MLGKFPSSSLRDFGASVPICGKMISRLSKPGANLNNSVLLLCLAVLSTDQKNKNLQNTAIQNRFWRVAALLARKNSAINELIGANSSQ
ncbi:MAG: hypothetical protein A2V89_04875 [Gammaproteobacteria bacterium RBG_16_37_9]|nr:MAG: hypothetical protein A2V89_04875 [Gammaproteobacteria bacterium RBG_16_37_9]